MLNFAFKKSSTEKFCTTPLSLPLLLRRSTMVTRDFTFFIWADFFYLKHLTSKWPNIFNSKAAEEVAERKKFWLEFLHLQFSPTAFSLQRFQKNSCKNFFVFSITHNSNSMPDSDIDFLSSRGPRTEESRTGATQQIKLNQTLTKLNQIGSIKIFSGKV